MRTTIVQHCTVFVYFWGKTNRMTFQEYLTSAERRELYKRHPQRNILGPISDRLKNVSHADVANWAEKYNGGNIPANLA